MRVSALGNWYCNVIISFFLICSFLICSIIISHPLNNIFTTTYRSKLKNVNFFSKSDDIMNIFHEIFLKTSTNYSFINTNDIMNYLINKIQKYNTTACNYPVHCFYKCFSLLSKFSLTPREIIFSITLDDSLFNNSNNTSIKFQHQNALIHKISVFLSLIEFINQMALPHNILFIINSSENLSNQYNNNNNSNISCKKIYYLNVLVLFHLEIRINDDKQAILLDYNPQNECSTNVELIDYILDIARLINVDIIFKNELLKYYFADSINLNIRNSIRLFQMFLTKSSLTPHKYTCGLNYISFNFNKKSTDNMMKLITFVFIGVNSIEDTFADNLLTYYQIDKHHRIVFNNYCYFIIILITFYLNNLYKNIVTQTTYSNNSINSNQIAGNKFILFYLLVSLGLTTYYTCWLFIQFKTIGIIWKIIMTIVFDTFIIILISAKIFNTSSVKVFTLFYLMNIFSVMFGSCINFPFTMIYHSIQCIAILSNTIIIKILNINRIFAFMKTIIKAIYLIITNPFTILYIIHNFNNQISRSFDIVEKTHYSIHPFIEYLSERNPTIIIIFVLNLPTWFCIFIEYTIKNFYE